MSCFHSLCLACAIGSVHAGEGDHSASRDRLVIHAGHLIAVPGEEPQEKMSIIVSGDRVVAIEKGFVGGDHVIDLSDKYVMPGLIDTHTHITVLLEEADPRGSLIKDYVSTKSSLVLRALPYARGMLKNGFTTVRSLGDPAGVLYDLRDAINNGLVDGPRIIGVENQLVVSGGDYDPVALRVRPEFEKMFDVQGIADGPLGFRRAVRKEVARGADVIKIRISGVSLLGGNGLMEYEEELQEIVTTAHRLGRKVAVHSHSAEGTMMALKAGVDSIEHGPVTPDMYPHFGNAFYVPTLMAFHVYRDLMTKILGHDVYAEVSRSTGAAFRAGVRVAFGSDAGAFPHARANEEFALLVEAGLTPADALRAATVTAADLLGRASDLGTIAKGKYADIVATDDNPLKDIRALERVSFVMKGGKTVP